MFKLVSDKYKVTKDLIDRDTQILGKYGVIHSHGTDELDVWVKSVIVAGRMERLGFKPKSWYDDGALFIRPVSDLNQMAVFIKARKRRVITEAMRTRGRELASRFNPGVSKPGLNGTLAP